MAQLHGESRAAPAPKEATRRPARRPRLHLLYYFLAAFDLVTVLLSLTLIDRIGRIYTDSVVVNQAWAERLEDLAQLIRLAGAVNAPGNDLFQSRDLDQERRRFEAAKAAFEEKMREVEADLSRENVTSDVQTPFAAIDSVMADMVGSTERLFAAFVQGDQSLAGEQMAAMDRHHGVMNAQLTDLVDRIRHIQRSHLDSELDRARSIRRAEWLIAGLILLMIAGVTVYGHRLATLAKRDVERIEAAVTERTEELRQSHAQLRHSERLAAIGTLAAGLGHDMNNVLFPLRCRLEMLSDKSSSGANEHFAAIRSAVSYLQQLSDGLRLLVADPDRVEENSPLDLAGWWSSASPMFRALLGREIQLVTEPHGMAGLPPVAIPPHHLTQVVFNLISNAVESITGPGLVTVKASAIGDRMRIEVRDTGSGMPEEVRQRALEPFFTTKARTFSTGLGLAIVRGLVSRAGGQVSIESAPGQGTTVRFDVPTAGLPSVQRRSPRPPEACVTLSDDRIREVALGVLRSQGLACTVGSHPQSADDVWVCDQEATDAEVGLFLSGSPHRRVVRIMDDPVAPATSAAPPAPGLIIVPRARLLEGLRLAAADTLTALRPRERET